MVQKIKMHFQTLGIHYGLAILSGILMTVSFAGYDQFYLAWIMFVPILWVLDDPQRSLKGAILFSWLFGFVAHEGVYTWLMTMIEDFGHLPAPLALLAYSGVCLAQSALFAAFGGLFYFLYRKRGLPLMVALPVAMILAEWLMPALFPSYITNSQYEQLWFIQSADIWGTLGLGALLTLSSGIIYELIKWKVQADKSFPKISLSIFAALMVANTLYGVVRIQMIDEEVAAAKKLKVGMVQTNMGIYQKLDEPAEGLRRHREQSLQLEEEGVDLLIWPESGYHYSINTDKETNVKDRVLGSIETPLIFGGLRRIYKDRKRELYNSAFLLNAEGDILGTYDKTYLLYFGETMPFGELFPFVYKWSP
ncbi:hypothetical protein KAI87_17085, partial [Myxococcota bacterium]|nr:hypothetical protein [Myxococcota bacterium]